MKNRLLVLEFLTLTYGTWGSIKHQNLILMFTYFCNWFHHILLVSHSKLSNQNQTISQRLKNIIPYQCKQSYSWSDGFLRQWTSCMIWLLKDVDCYTARTVQQTCPFLLIAFCWTFPLLLTNGSQAYPLVIFLRDLIVCGLQVFNPLCQGFCSPERLVLLVPDTCIWGLDEGSLVM